MEFFCIYDNFLIFMTLVCVWFCIYDKNYVYVYDISICCFGGDVSGPARIICVCLPRECRRRSKKTNTERQAETQRDQEV